MNFNLSRSVHFYYLFALFVLGGMLTAGLYHFWHQGPTNIENISSIFEANLQIDDMKKRQDVNRLRQLVINDRVREAVRLVEVIENDTRNLHRLRGLESYAYLQQDLEGTKTSLNKLLSFPELSTIVLVFSNKINNFETFVSGNNWNTLTRTTRRLQARLTPERLRSADFYSFSRLSEMTRDFDNDFELMKNVTTNSVLSTENKNLILTQLKTFETELDMLKSYTAQMKIFKDSYNQFEKTYQTWMSQIEPAISLRRIEFEKTSQNILLAWVGVIGTVFMLALGGFLAYGLNKRKIKGELERMSNRIIKDVLLPIDVQNPLEFSLEFRDDLAKYREYIHKRMSFGSIFQDAMPFSSILLDSNLNVVWANSLFYDHWPIKNHQVDDGSTTWDYLQRFTNLGEDDPVLQALNQNLAGIYHIQVKHDHETEAQPFEMYVSPVEYAGQKRIMIIFYPLSSLEQTLSDQTKSLVGPVMRSLDAMENGEWDEDFEERIEKDFDIAGILHVHQKFSKYNAYIASQKNALHHEIEKLNGYVSDRDHLIEDVHHKLGDYKKIQQQMMAQFQEIKELLISLVEMRGKLESFYQSTSSTSKVLLKEEMELLGQAKNVNQLLTENSQAFDTVCKVRDDFKEIKNKIDNYRATLSQLVDQTLLFGRNENPQSRFEDSLGQVKIEMRNFDKLLTSFSKVSTQLDVGLSKVSMILGHNQAPDLSSLEHKFKSSRDAIETDMYDVGRLVREAYVTDEQLIDSLKQMYGSFKECLEQHKEIEFLLSQETQKTQECENSAQFL